MVSLLGPKVFWPSRSWKREPRTARFGAIGNALGRRPASRLAGYGAALKTLHGVGSVAAPAVSADRATADYRLTLT